MNELSFNALSFPIQKSDIVRLSIYAVGIDVQYTATARIRLDNGKIVPYREDFSAQTVNTTVEHVLPLPAGDLISFAVIQNPIQPGRSEGYAYLDILQNSNIPTSPVLRLTQGYIGGQQGLIWPYVDQNQTDQRTLSQIGLSGAGAAGTPLQVSPPAGIGGIIRAIMFTLVTDATVASRVPYVVGVPSTGLTANMPAMISHPASTTRIYHMFPGADTINLFSYVTAPIAPDIRIGIGGYVEFNALNLQAGDEFTLNGLILEQFTN